MKRTLLWIFLAAVALLAVAVGCAAPKMAAKKSASYEGSYDTASALPASDKAGLAAEGRQNNLPAITEMKTASMVAAQRHVIRNGNISLRVKDVRATKNTVTELVQNGGGYVESTSTAGIGTSNPTVDMTVRVPATGFEDAMVQLEELGTLLDSSTDTDDVTAELVDLGARIKTLSAKEETFREMLRASRNINDVVTLQERLTEARTEIERMEAQRKSLSELAELSAIKAHLTQTATVPTAPKDPNWFSNTIGGATTSFMGSMQTVVAVLTWIVVYSPFWLLPLLLVRWGWKRLVRRTPQPAAE